MERRNCLTGTPGRNGDSDIWSLLFFCGYTGVDNPKNWTYALFTEEVRKMILNVEYSEKVMTLPPKKSFMYEVFLNETEKEIYKFYFLELWDAYNMFIDGGMDGISFAVILGLFTRLRQICIAPYLMTTESKNLVYMKSNPIEPLAVEGSLKLEVQRLGPIIRNSHLSGYQSTKLGSIITFIWNITSDKDNSVIVFSSFSSALRMIALFLDHNKIGYELVDGKIVGSKRQEKLNNFRNGKCQILLMNYKVGANGLNLTKANHVITIEPWWSPVIESQAESRTHRMGQTREVIIHRIIVAGTIEKQIRDIGLAKDTILQSYLDVGKAGNRKAVPGLDKANSWKNPF